MILEYTSVFKHPNDDKWLCIRGVDRSAKSDRSDVYSWFAAEAIQWRIAEYDLSDDQADVAFKMIFSESMEAVDLELNTDTEAHIHPFRMDASDARDAKNRRMSIISANQRNRLSSLPVVPSNDRVDLYQSAMDLIGPITGRGLEHKRLIASAYRNVADYPTRLKYEEAIRRFERGDANTVSDALLMGEQDAKRKMAIKQ